jgi:hypothetical protein
MSFPTDDTHASGLQLPIKFGMVCPLYWAVAIGATGAPTLDAANSSPGVTIARTSAGLYAITFAKGAIAKVFSGGSIQNDDVSPTAADGRIVSDCVFDLAAGTGNILVTAGDDGDVADPTDGARLYYKLELRCGT